MLEFNPETFGDLMEVVSGERNSSFRMVLGYWDMAASTVTTGAIDGDAFRSAHGEIFATFSKVQPFLAELRNASAEPEFCKHLEAVVMAAPDAPRAAHAPIRSLRRQPGARSCPIRRPRARQSAPARRAAWARPEPDPCR